MRKDRHWTGAHRLSFLMDAKSYGGREEESLAELVLKPGNWSNLLNMLHYSAKSEAAGINAEHKAAKCMLAPNKHTV